MHLFGKKQKNGGKSQPKRKKKKKKITRFKRPSDVKLFYQMPVYLVIAITFLVVGLSWIHRNNAAYKASVLASSMGYKEQLPLWGGTSKGNLTLGHTRLSKDGKTLAVEIQYDDTAHQSLSSFGNRYKLRLVDTYDNKMKDAKIHYGIFGTDGSGVLTIYNPHGFKNKSFIVMLIDNGQLVTSDDLTDSTQMSDGDLDKSITAELSNPDGNDDSSSNVNSKRAKLPPLYYVRLNAKNAKRNYRNWDNDSQIIDDLFVKTNLKDIKSKMQQVKVKIKKAKTTLNEMNKRLEENPNDEVAQQNKSDIEGSLQSLETNYNSLEKRYDKLSNSTISDDVLDPEQTKFKEFTVDDINNIS